MKKLLLLLIALPILSSAHTNIYHPPQGDNFDTILAAETVTELDPFLESTDPLDRGWAWARYLMLQGPAVYPEFLDYLAQEKDTDALLTSRIQQQLRGLGTIPTELHAELNNKLKEMLERVLSEDWLRGYGSEVILDLLLLLWRVSPDDAWSYIEEIFYADWASEDFKRNLLSLIGQYDTPASLSLVKEAVFDEGYLGATAVDRLIRMIGTEATEILYEKVISTDALYHNLGERGTLTASSNLAEWGDERMLLLDLNALPNVEEQTSESVIRRLSFFNTLEVRDAIYEYYLNHDCPRIMNTLWRMGDERAVKPILLEILTNAELVSKLALLTAISFDSGVKPYVLDIANDEGSELMQAAWIVLTVWNEPNTTEYWENNLAGVQLPENRYCILTQIFKDDKEAARDIFYWAATNDPDESVRKQAQRFLDRTN